MVENYNKPIPHGYSEVAWRDKLKKGRALPDKQAEDIQVSFSIEKMLSGIQEQLSKFPNMSAEKAVTKVVAYVLEEIPNSYYPEKDYVRSVQNDLLRVLREKGEKAFVNIIDNLEYADVFDFQNKSEMAHLTQKMKTKIFDAVPGKKNSGNYKSGKYKRQLDSTVQRREELRKEQSSRKFYSHGVVPNKNLTPGGRDEKSKNRDKSYSQARALKEERRYF
jgi:hypothetical protein